MRLVEGISVTWGLIRMSWSWAVDLEGTRCN